MYDLQTNPITFDEKVKSLVAEDFGINEDELKLALNIIDFVRKEYKGLFARHLLKACEKVPDILNDLLHL